MSQEMQKSKVFFSYAQTSQQHKNRVRLLADRLIRESGIDVLLDQYDLLLGDDVFAYMERCVSDPTVTKVVAICDENYMNKADGRSGGVGTETTIMSPNVYKQISGVQNKFVALLFERLEDGSEPLPTMFQGKRYIDMSSEILELDNFEALERFLADKPELKKPPLGKTPDHLIEEPRVQLSTSAKARAIKSALDTGKTSLVYRRWLDYLEGIKAVLAGMPPAIHSANQHNDDIVWNELGYFVSTRAEFHEVFSNLIQGEEVSDIKLLQSLADFFEGLYGLPIAMSSDGNPKRTYDHIYCIIHTLFLETIATALKLSKFQIFIGLVTHSYIVGQYGNRVGTFSDLNHFSEILENRSKRLQLNRNSLLADNIVIGVSKQLGRVFLCQADLILFLRSRLGATDSSWYPRTIPFWRDLDFPLFLRAESILSLNTLKDLLGVDRTVDIKKTLLKFAADNHFIGNTRLDYGIDFEEVVHLEKLGTRA
jgi:hypothetical protein